MAMEFNTPLNENESELSASAYALLGIVREYERLTCLLHPENPVMYEGENMLNKVNVAMRIFQERATNGEINQKSLIDLGTDLTVSTLRLSNLVLHLNAQREIVLLPSRRRFLGIGGTELRLTLENLVEYNRISDNIISEQCMESLRSISGKADRSCEGLMEFRIVNILIILLTLLPDDKQSISYLSQLMLSQWDLSVGGAI